MRASSVWECFKAWEDERTSRCEKTSSIWEGRGGRGYVGASLPGGIEWY
jgi:hypothetical protein